MPGQAWRLESNQLANLYFPLFLAPYDTLPICLRSWDKPLSENGKNCYWADLSALGTFLPYWVFRHFRLQVVGGWQLHPENGKNCFVIYHRRPVTVSLFLWYEQFAQASSEWQDLLPANFLNYLPHMGPVHFVAKTTHTLKDFTT